MNIRQQRILIDELGGAAYADDLAARDFATVADTLNAQAEIPNPDPQPDRPKLLSWSVFMDLLDSADVLVMYQYGTLARDLRAALEANDRTVTLAIWRGLKTVLTPASVTAVQTEASKTEPDPTWPPTILQPSIAMTLGLPVVTEQDVETAWQRIAGE